MLVKCYVYHVNIVFSWFPTMHHPIIFPFPVQIERKMLQYFDVRSQSKHNKHLYRPQIIYTQVIGKKNEW